MHINQEDLLARAKSYMSEHRWLHTLGVKDAALKIGKILLPDEEKALSAAALLHDIAKEKSTEEQCELIKRYNITISREDLQTKQALHAPAGAALIMRDFPDYATDNILSAVANHTLGAPDMSIFDKIIYIADYIEDGRTALACKRIREFVYTRIFSEDVAHATRVINQAMIMAIDFTEEHLRLKGLKINQRSLDTKRALLALI